jgi:hypothetical protein
MEQARVIPEPFRRSETGLPSVRQPIPPDGTEKFKKVQSAFFSISRTAGAKLAHSRTYLMKSFLKP